MATVAGPGIHDGVRVTLPMRRLRQLISRLFTEEESFVLLIGIKLMAVTMIGLHLAS